MGIGSLRSDDPHLVKRQQVGQQRHPGDCEDGDHQRVVPAKMVARETVAGQGGQDHHEQRRADRIEYRVGQVGVEHPALQHNSQQRRPWTEWPDHALVALDRPATGGQVETRCGRVAGEDDRRLARHILLALERDQHRGPDGHQGHEDDEDQRKIGQQAVARLAGGQEGPGARRFLRHLRRSYLSCG